MNCLKYLVLSLTLVSNAHAYYQGPMNERIFAAFSQFKFELSPEGLPPLRDRQTGRYVYFTRDEDGSPVLANRLVSGTKVSEGIYRIDEVTCYGYENSNGELSCDFNLEVINPGGSVFFLGTSPQMSADTDYERATIRAGFYAPGFNGIYSLTRKPITD